MARMHNELRHKPQNSFFDLTKHVMESEITWKQRSTPNLTHINSQLKAFGYNTFSEEHQAFDLPTPPWCRTTSRKSRLNITKKQALPKIGYKIIASKSPLEK